MAHKAYYLNLFLNHPPLQKSLWFFFTGRGEEMTYLYPNPVLQMKHSFWRINFYVRRSGYRSRCKPFAQRWSFLADWKRLMLQKDFSHSFWCTRDTWSFFVPNSVCFWRKGKCFTLLSQLATFFSKQLSYLRPIFVNLSTEKHLYCQLIVAFEKKT